MIVAALIVMLLMVVFYALPDKPRVGPDAGEKQAELLLGIPASTNAAPMNNVTRVMTTIDVAKQTAKMVNDRVDADNKVYQELINAGSGQPDAQQK